LETPFADQRILTETGRLCFSRILGLAAAAAASASPASKKRHNSERTPQRRARFDSDHVYSMVVAGDSARSGTMAIVLIAEDIAKRYGGVYALKRAHFDLRAGEVHALMGENGAGKSTLARILAGSTRADGGTISIDGHAVHIAHPLDAQRLGIAIIYQELDLFPSLSVRENLLIGNERAEIRQRLSQWGLDCDLRRPLGSLAIGQQQLVAIARALSLNARILLMDEPTSSLSADAAERLFTLIGELKQREVAIVYVSHKMDEIFRLADRATVLRDGETVGTVEIAQTDANELIRMMVGRELKNAARNARTPGEIVLRVSGLTTRKLKEIAFELRRGEVLGIAGLVGSGRSELGAALYGLDPVVRGTIESTATIGLVPEDRRTQGLMMQMSVLENGTLGVLRQVNGPRLVHRASASADVE